MESTWVRELLLNVLATKIHLFGVFCNNLSFFMKPLVTLYLHACLATSHFSLARLEVWTFSPFKSTMVSLFVTFNVS